MKKKYILLSITLFLIGLIIFFVRNFDVLVLNLSLLICIYIVIKNIISEKTFLSSLSSKTKLFLILPAILLIISSYFHIKDIYSGKNFFTYNKYINYTKEEAKKTNEFTLTTMQLKNNQGKIVQKKVYRKAESNETKSKTINEKFQKEIEKILNDNEQFSDDIQIGVLDLNDGGLIALAKNLDCKEDNLIRCFDELNFPASTFKVLVSASILESNKSLPSVSCSGKGCKAHKGFSNVSVDLKHGLIVSCNTAFIKYMNLILSEDNKAILENFYSLVYDFNYSVLPTRHYLAPEKYNIVKCKNDFSECLDKNEPVKADYLTNNFFSGNNTEIYKPYIINPKTIIIEGISNIAIGEELVKTNIFHQLQLISTIANDGYLMKIRINKNDPIEKKNKRVLSQKTSNILKDWLTLSVNNKMYEVTGGAYKTLHGFKYGKVAGKTGTSENNDSWFISFYPANNPKIAMAVFMKKSKKSQKAVLITKEIITKYKELGELR